MTSTEYQTIEGHLNEIRRDLNNVLKLVESFDKRLSSIEENTRRTSISYPPSFERRPSSIAPDTLSQHESVDVTPFDFEHPSAYVIPRPHSPSELRSTFRKVGFTESSVILSPDDAGKLRSMVTSAVKQPGVFKLLYRASEQGYRAVDFHHHCDLHENIMVVILTTDNHVIGGFSSTPFGGTQGHKSSPGAFLYCFRPLEPSQDLEHGVILTKLEGTGITGSCEEYGIMQDSEMGPIFGVSDLYICDNADREGGGSLGLNSIYSSPEIPVENAQATFSGGSVFGVKELEVFQLVT
ncbi:hypothetical protein P9112_001969 [Eukaryota sp. TZLM1-RC]